MPIGVRSDIVLVLILQQYHVIHPRSHYNKVQGALFPWRWRSILRTGVTIHTQYETCYTVISITAINVSTLVDNMGGVKYYWAKNTSQSTK